MVFFGNWKFFKFMILAECAYVHMWCGLVYYLDGMDLNHIKARNQDDVQNFFIFFEKYDDHDWKFERQVIYRYGLQLSQECLRPIIDLTLSQLCTASVIAMKYSLKMGWEICVIT